MIPSKFLLPITFSAAALTSAAPLLELVAFVPVLSVQTEVLAQLEKAAGRRTGRSGSAATPPTPQPGW